MLHGGQQQWVPFASLPHHGAQGSVALASELSEMEQFWKQEAQPHPRRESLCTPDTGSQGVCVASRCFATPLVVGQWEQWEDPQYGASPLILLPLNS